MEKVDTSKELDASSVIIKSNAIKSQEQDTISRSGNDAHVDDADIRPIYDEEPKVEVQMTTNNNVSAKGQQHTEQPKFINGNQVDQNAAECVDERAALANLIANLTLDTSQSKQNLQSSSMTFIHKTLIIP
ncbi:hypothetical protein Tco_0440925, partial [Tanacetum coccineum]